MSLLVIDLGCAVVTLGVAFGDDEVLPSLVEVRLVDPFHLDAFGREGVLTAQVAAIDDSGGAHNPVGNSCEIFYEVEGILELFVGGARCVSAWLRGMDRKRGVIIVRY